MKIELFSQEQCCKFLGPEDFDRYLERYKDHSTRLKYFNLDSGLWRSSEEFFVVAIEGDKIIGVLLYVVVENKTTSDHNHYLSYVSVDPEHQNKGIAKALISHWAQFVIRTDLGECGCSGYTQNGFDWLKPILENLPFAVQKREREF